MTISLGLDGKPRCSWCIASDDYIAYHDDEWGHPTADDQRLFEKLCLEGFQAGLSWRTILVKRENFRKAFKQFNINKVAKFTASDVNNLLENEGIVRHRGKIEAVINNAQKAKELIKSEGSLAAYFWQFEPAHQASQAISTSPESILISKDLKKRGWKFVGPTTVYSFMQAMGLVNDHHADCYMREKVRRMREAFTPPSSK